MSKQLISTLASNENIQIECDHCQEIKDRKDMYQKKKCWVYNRWDRHMNPHYKFDLPESYYLEGCEIRGNLVFTPIYVRKDCEEFKLIPLVECNRFDNGEYFCKRCVYRSVLDEELEYAIIPKYYDWTETNFYIWHPDATFHEYPNGNRHFLDQVTTPERIEKSLNKKYKSLAKKYFPNEYQHWENLIC